MRIANFAAVWEAGQLLNVIEGRDSARSHARLRWPVSELPITGLVTVIIMLADILDAPSNTE